MIIPHPLDGPYFLPRLLLKKKLESLSSEMHCLQSIDNDCKLQFKGTFDG